MKRWLWVGLLLLQFGCTARDLRCAGPLRPINALKSADAPPSQSRAAP